MEPAQPRRFLFTQAGGQEILSPAGCVGFAFLLVVNHGVIRVHNIIGALVPAAAGCSAGLLAAKARAAHIGARLAALRGCAQELGIAACMERV